MKRTHEEYEAKIRQWAENGIPRTVLTEGEVQSLAYAMAAEVDRVLDEVYPIAERQAHALRKIVYEANTALRSPSGGEDPK